MKLFAVTFAFVALSACGTSKTSSDVNGLPGFQVKPNANSITCESEDKLEVSYATTSIVGKPSYSINKPVCQPAEGELGCQAIESLLSVNDEELIERKETDKEVLIVGTRAIPDFAVYTYTLSLPKNLRVSMGDVLEFSTTLVELTSPTSIVGPLPGQKDEVKEHALKCRAEFVQF